VLIFILRPEGARDEKYFLDQFHHASSGRNHHYHSPPVVETTGYITKPLRGKN